MPGKITPRHYPNRLPPRYVERTLERLLPSQDELDKLTHEQLIAVYKFKDELVQDISRNPAKYFQPNVGGQLEYMAFSDPDVRGRYFFAGNKTGKTTSTCIIVAEYMCGRRLWGLGGAGGRGVDPAPQYPIAAKGVYYTEDFASHEETIIPTYLTWCPRNEILTLVRSQSGNVSHIVHRNGAVLYFRTYDQGYEKAEGKDYDIAACDEPPPRELFTAIFRGLVALGGLFYIGATLLKEAWLYDELEHSFVRGFSGDIYDNPWIDAKARDDFVATLSDEERAVRVHGKPLTLTGLIYPTFKDGAPTVVPDELPWNLLVEATPPIILGVDPHERKPLHVEWGYILPNDNVFFFDWAHVHPGSYEEIFGYIEQRERQHRARTSLVIMDPNRGKARQAGDTCWMDQFEAHGFQVLLGIDDLNIGHTAVREYLTSGRMRWTVLCRGKDGPIHQMLRYSWDDWARQVRERRDFKEKPKDKHKDFPDIHRYIAMAGLSYDMLTHINDIVDVRPLVQGPRASMRPRAYA